MSTITSMLTTVPVGLLLGACILYWGVPFDSSLANTVYQISYVIYGIAMLLSWWFNRSRVFFTVFVIALVQFALSDRATEMIAIPAYTAAIYPIVCLLLPINICIFFLLKERGIFNGWGLGRFGIILSQIIYIAVAVVANDKTLLDLFYKAAPVNSMTLPAAFPQSSALAYGFTLLLFIFNQVKNKTQLGNAFLAVAAATMLGLYLKSEALALPVFFSAAGVVFIAAVIQDSYSMAYLDELTGLPARRALKEDLLKLSGEYTIAMVDIDFFKKFNDAYGHDTGDDVLRLVASVLKGVEGGGKAFRYGGEEFTILFPRTRLADALPHLEKLRAEVEKCPYQYRGKTEKTSKKKTPAKSGKPLFVTISIGVAEKSEKHTNTSEVIKSADNALYRAKKKGRNCVCK
ncbi:GGDEF domain-containing protein [Anaerospora sp.]|uniref:GGDEF domain-containing protein n=1 Tax=Anaerospora sp. TaxID=1960278 RepID=UPI00289C7F9E|nr:GGDEF domain-containing protein [Anaerospora sp.]